MIVCAWLNGSPDPHYGGHRVADRSELHLLESTSDHRVTVLTDCLPAGVDGPVEFVTVEPLGGNPYFDRWRHLHAWLEGRDDFVWATDANDVRLLNDPYPDWLRVRHLLYVGSEPTDGPNARSVGFWWMRGLHPDHAEWIDANADLPLLNAGIVGAHAPVLREFVGSLLEAFEGVTDVTEMAAINKVLYERWDLRVTGYPVHTPMWSFTTADPRAIWAHK